MEKKEIIPYPYSFKVEKPNEPVKLPSVIAFERFPHIEYLPISSPIKIRKEDETK